VYLTGIATVNKEVDIDILRHLGEEVRRKRPQKMENQHLVYPSRQCSSTPADFS